MRRVELDESPPGPYIRPRRDGVLRPTQRRKREVWSRLGRAQREFIEGADARSVAERVADDGRRLLTATT